MGLAGSGAEMPELPRDPLFDSSLALLADPYGFIAKRCRRFGSDVFEARLLLQRTICMTGRDCAELFCDNERFVRKGAAPSRVEKSLFGKGGVQGLDGDAHRQRKRMFLSLMSSQHIAELTAIVDELWIDFARRWESRESVELYSEVRELLTRAVCRWSAVPLPEEDVAKRTRQLTALFDAAGALGPRHWQARLSRRQAERWIAKLIDEVRRGAWTPPPASACFVVASHRDANGELLDRKIAAVELLNVLRPTVAVAVYLVQAATALHEQRSLAEELRSDAAARERFAQEVRRFYPFFPASAARVRRDFEWRGFRFRKGRRVLLDLYGINHDPRLWQRPGEFLPGRFRRWDGSAFNFVPQGAGSHERNHRCPGEWITLALVDSALRFFTEGIDYELPAQDLRIDCGRLPALPRSRFVMAKVRLREPVAVRELPQRLRAAR